MKIKEYPDKEHRPHILAARFLEGIGLKVKTKWHNWDDLFPWGWHVRGYKRNPQKGLFKKKWVLVFDVWPGEFESASWAFNDGAIKVLDKDFVEQAKELAQLIEKEFQNSITVTIPQ